MDIKEVIEQEQKYIMATYDRLPVCFIRGQGTRLWDEEGSEYIDFASGIGVCNVGHVHPEVVKAVKTQVEKLMHVSNLYYTMPQIELAKKLVGLVFPGKCFFANSGAEANEAAIKLARRYNNGFEIITTFNSFHGRTLATLAATGQPDKQKPFRPLPAGFKHVPFNDFDALKMAISEETCAIMLEVIQGEGGVNVADVDYLKNVRKLCDEKHLLMILDEVQTGMGRTGKFLAVEHYGILPDMVTLAKGLGGGLPIGALIAKSQVAEAFEKGDHGTTFGGNPLVCSTALAVLDVYKKENLIKKAEQQGEYLLKKLGELSKQHGEIEDVRGKGLMVGIELKRDVAKAVLLECLEEGIVVNRVGPDTLRLLPPLTITKSEIDKLLNVLSKALSHYPAI